MMRLVKDLMTSDVVWVNPSAPVKTAVILMKSHNIGALPVIRNNDGVVGLVTLKDLLGEPPDASIADLMQTDFPIIEPTATVHAAAELMRKSGMGFLLVMDHGQLEGILSESDLMSEIGRTYDPLTDLPWSDTFREWAVNALKQGTEISVILFDLDQFGKFNKRHGHVMGDTVLKAAANVFKTGTDPDMDLVCRYGGDEFAIVSIRLADESELLAARLQERIAALKIPGLPEGVTATWGMFGGRRTKEREDMHYEATIDDLITRASKNCIGKKNKVENEAEAAAQAEPEKQTGRQSIPEPEPAPVQEPQPQPARSAQRDLRLKIESVIYSSKNAGVSARVALKKGDAVYEHEVSGYTLREESIVKMFAEATAGAICRSLAPDHGIVIDEISAYESERNDEIITVVAVYITPSQTSRLVGSAIVRRGDRYRATAAAVLSAVNRLSEIARGDA